MYETLLHIEHIEKKYAKGEHIAYQGDLMKHFYLLTSGSVKTEIISESGFVMPMEVLKAPYPLAVAFLFADNNRFPVDVVAKDECTVLLLSREAVERHMVESPEFLHTFMSFMANHMQFLSQRLKLFAHRGIKQKFIYYISSEAFVAGSGGTFNIGRSVSSLALYLGVERPSLSRAIHEMVADGAITFSRGRGKILDYEKLLR